MDILCLGVGGCGGEGVGGGGGKGFVSGLAEFKVSWSPK